jgi:hypothetical protein
MNNCVYMFNNECHSARAIGICSGCKEYAERTHALPDNYIPCQCDICLSDLTCRMCINSRQLSDDLYVCHHPLIRGTALKYDSGEYDVTDLPACHMYEGEDDES